MLLCYSRVMSLSCFYFRCFAVLVLALYHKLVYSRHLSIDTVEDCSEIFSNIQNRPKLINRSPDNPPLYREILNQAPVSCKINQTSNCTCVLPDRHYGLVPTERYPAELIGPRPQTQSLSYGLSELHVPLWGIERPAGAERLLEMEFHLPHMDSAQKQVSGDPVCQL